MIPISDTPYPSDRRPYVTWGLLALLVVAQLVYLGESEADRSDRFVRHSAIPCELSRWEPLTMIEHGRLIHGTSDSCDDDTDSVLDLELAASDAADEPYATDKHIWVSALASLVFHAGWLHLILNGWALWIFGDNVELRIGRIGFVALFVAAGLGGLVAHTLVYPASMVPLVGASGGIAGLMGAYVILFPENDVILYVQFRRVPYPAVSFVMLWALLQGLIAYTDETVGWAAHLGGLLIGALGGVLARLWWRWSPRHRLGPSASPV
ncbi:MAG: rhomboid family intramembrane serine protease [Acidimicrobiales bacterium]|nr:rhomboid family intramembrane serine protease [Acidimicrobiales bacterium]